MKVPDKCENMTDIRKEIDRLDRAIINLIGQRFAYVKAAAKFKTSPRDVRASDRLKTMLEQRRIWAEAEGLHPDAIEKMYRDLVNHFIAEEMNYWQSQK